MASTSFWPIANRTIGFQSLVAVATTGAGAAIPVAGARDFGLQVITTATVACQVVLEGSNDGGTTWSTLITWDITTPQTSGTILFAADKPCGQVRANLKSVDASKVTSAWISAA